MASKDLTGTRVAIVVPDDFEQAEFTEPRKALQDAGADVVVIAPKEGKVQGMKHDEKADRFDVDMRLDEADPEDVDAVMLPGGALNADFLRAVKKAQEFVCQIDLDKKPMAVICHAPWVLVSAGLAKGRTLTSYYTIQDDIRNAGANWVDKEKWCATATWSPAGSPATFRRSIAK
jgi:protease I